MSQVDDPQGLRDTMPGCGMAAYVAILGFFCLLGIAGIAGATMGLLKGGGEQPRALRAGNQVAVWQLAPLREAGLTGLTEVPVAWHDETMSFDGTVACALMLDRVVRVKDGQGWTIPYDGLSSVEMEGDEYAGGTLLLTGIHQDQAVSLECEFGAEEGLSRLYRMLLAEQAKHRSPATAPPDPAVPSDPPPDGPASGSAPPP